MTKIVQFSDVHWRGLTRHEEYTEIFNTFFQQLKTKIKPDYIIGTGDFFHTKTQNITPEVIDKLTWMFRELSEIAPVYLILGNHDGNLTNENRQDTISPIISAMNNSRIKLFKQSTNYIIPTTDINLCVLSCFDKEGWGNVTTNPSLINLALFHGSVSGCEVDTDWVMSHGEVDRNIFDKYDFALLGDIHKTQFLGHRTHSGVTRDLKPWVGYPGSFCTQNYGESKVKGYLVWDIRSKTDWDVTFEQIPNRYSFHTINWMGNVEETIDAIMEECNGELENKRIRISSDEKIFDIEIKELTSKLKTQHKVSEVVIKATTTSNINDLEMVGNGIQKISLRNDPNTLIDLYDNFIVRDYKSTVNESQKVIAKEYIKSSLEKVKLSDDESVRDVNWSIKNLKFNNLFKYGEGNGIDFQKIRGITGIFGKNTLGKSSIVGAIMFALYNTTDRGPVKSAYIINKNKTEGSATISIEVNGIQYIIERKIAKAKKRGGIFDEEKAATSLRLLKIHKDGSEEELINENGDTRNDTDKVIRKLIGNSQDFLLTTFANQGGMNKFIEEGATQRKSILNRFLDLDIFEKLNKLANEELSICNAKAKKFQNTDWNQASLTLEENIKTKEENISNLKITLEEVKSTRENLLIFLQQKGIVKLNNIQKALNKCNSSILELESKIANIKNDKNSLLNKKEIISKKLLELEKSIAVLPIEELKIKKQSLQSINKKYNEAKIILSSEQQKLDTQVKSIKKLEMVPCGTLFPTCHYIKDSYEDKKTFDNNKKEVLSLLKSFEEIRAEAELLQSEKIEENIDKYNKISLDIQSETLNLDNAKKQIDFLDKNLVIQVDALDSSKKEQEKLASELESFGNKSFNEKIAEEKELSRKINDYETNLQTYYQELGSDKNKLENILKESREAKAIIEEQRIYDSIVQAFSKNGIPAFILKSQLPAINSELNNILAGVVPFRISLETEVGSNTLDVFIEDKQSRRVIELASGMEKMVASIAVRVALSSLSSLPKSDILILDESFTQTDAENLPKIIELLQTIKSRFKSIIIITHVDAIKEVAGSIISIQDNGLEGSFVNF